MEREEALYNLTLGFILKKFREHSFPENINTERCA